MTKKLANILLITLVFLTSAAYAYTESHYEIASDHKVYYKYQEAQAGKQTIVMLNGLIYATEFWNNYLDELTAQGYGVLLLAYSTQPESLRALEETPYYAKFAASPFGPNQAGLEIQTLVDEVMTVVDSLGIDRFTLQSLSYGSIAASTLALQYTDRIDQLILAAPAVLPTARYYPIGQSRYDLYFTMRQTTPDYADYLYDAEFFVTLSATVTPDKFSYEGVRFQDFFNGVFQMARSTKWFDLKDYTGESFPKTYLFVASDEEVELKKDQLLFWSLMTGNEAKGSLVIFENTAHAIMGVAPKAAAEMTIKAMTGSLTKEKYNVDAN